MSVVQGSPRTEGLKIGVVTGRFNFSITGKLEKGAVDKLKELGLEESQMIVTRVPGAFEIPLAAKALIESGCDGVVACGAVIRGETSHYDYVCNAVERGCSQIQIETGSPVGFGVITVENRAQADSRSGGAKGNKGAEAAEVTLEMIDLIRKIKKLTRKGEKMSEETNVEESVTRDTSPSNLSPKIIYGHLHAKVSDYNARLLLNSALTETGIECAEETMLGKDDAKDLCLMLIKQGGPAFQVGQEVYKQYIQ